MDQLAGTDPVPYISLAYGIGFGGLVGYALFVFIQRRKLTTLLRSLNQESDTPE